MDWLLHNAIADMRGPAFLVFFAVVIGAIWVGCGWFFRQLDASRGLRAAQIPPEVDAHEVAYLRGGEKEVLRLIVFQLVQRGYLLVRSEQEPQISQNPQTPNRRHLSAIEAEIFDWFRKPKQAKDIFELVSVSSEMKDFCAPLEEKTRQEQWVTPGEARRTASRLGWMGAAVMLGLGGYKFVVALNNGYYDVGFLIPMTVVATVGLLILYVVLVPRLSYRGREYLKKLQSAFGRLKDRASSLTRPVGDEDLSALVAIFGIGILTGTIYDSYPKMFQRAAAGPQSTSGSCGSSCGVSCGSVSSDSGSSCGGGGGCGGCGGGD